MTQYHCEKHKYQLILHVDLPDDARAEYRRQRDLYPDDTFVLCNRVEDKMSVPQLGGGIADRLHRRDLSRLPSAARSRARELVSLERQGNTALSSTRSR
jgi:hypothetical protein